MRLPRDVSAGSLAGRCRNWATSWPARKGSHLRYVTQRGGTHHVTIPNHSPLKTGTLHGILKGVSPHHGLSVEELVQQLEL